MKKRYIIATIILAVLATLVFILPLLLLRFDDNDDGVTDLVIYTDGFSIIKRMDFDGDGIFDYKEYNYLTGGQIKYFLVLNEKFNNLTITQHYVDGQVCSIKSGQRCPKRKVKLRKTTWELDSEIIFGTGRW